MSDGREQTSVTLRAAIGYPLADDRVRETVVSAARALAERQGVEIVRLNVGGDQITVTLIGPEVVGVGFAAELRRTTEAWYVKRTGAQSLWGPAHKQDT